jgi:hypothetical protein
LISKGNEILVFDRGLMKGGLGYQSRGEIWVLIGNNNLITFYKFILGLQNQAILNNQAFNSNFFN